MLRLSEHVRAAVQIRANSILQQRTSHGNRRDGAALYKVNQEITGDEQALCNSKSFSTRMLHHCL